ncbi:MAG: hypothetical protein COW01_11445 [Bdellovibrionales bacterium CG12_big_fil_rev_8_21_14_0_65_38_15]|nr:MAG: hypothetical protein COW79_11475 [Bdellovibrionales bacterium CG22_combo_CG10-13_8_21_14_all_38_13]PIQ54225.1 MAG: hypothetical protein COW01_11445 [Bdellovibrionales bacterium CG12_big_fil_rev_8_21_14_0_65_38_15]PIR29283.1 MAG: hypothetical protein COV38_11090 [Bdellovibrionales bacterium CG11_big_fil_rev_8_21_14_0_20_38_13]
MLRKISHYFAITSLILGISFSANAKRFTSQFCEFELPPGWECALEGTEWVCQSTNEQRKKEAIIILAAKERGPQDSMMEYEAYLKKNKTFMLPGGKTQVSEPKDIKLREVNGQNWVDSLHLASEVPGFYTQYLATVKESLGIAVTFSVGKDFYDSYRGVFENIISTMRVFVPKKYQQGGEFQLKTGDEQLLGDSVIPDADNRLNIGVQKKKGQTGEGDPMQDYLIYGGAAAVVAFLLAKARKKKGGAKKSKKKKS